MSDLNKNNYTQRFAEYLVSLDREVLSDPLREKLKLHILDTLGAILHGSTTPWNRQVREVVLSWGGKPEAWILGALALAWVAWSVTILT